MKKFVKIVTLATLLCAQGAEASWSPDTVRNVAAVGLGLGFGALYYRNYLKKSVNEQIDAIVGKACKNAGVLPSAQFADEQYPEAYWQLDKIMQKARRGSCAAAGISGQVYKSFNPVNLFAVQYLFPLSYMKEEVRVARAKKVLDFTNGFFQRKLRKLRDIYNGIPTFMHFRGEMRKKREYESDFKEIFHFRFSKQEPIQRKFMNKLKELHEKYLNEIRAFTGKIDILISKGGGNTLVVKVPLQNATSKPRVLAADLLAAFKKVCPEESPFICRCVIESDGEGGIASFCPEGYPMDWKIYLARKKTLGVKLFPPVQSYILSLK